MGEITILSKELPEDTKTIHVGETWSEMPHCFKPSKLPLIVAHKDGSSSHFSIDVKGSFGEGWSLMLKKVCYDAVGKTVFSEYIATKDITAEVEQRLSGKKPEDTPDFLS